MAGFAGIGAAGMTDVCTKALHSHCDTSVSDPHGKTSTPTQILSAVNEKVKNIFTYKNKSHANRYELWLTLLQINAKTFGININVPYCYLTSEKTGAVLNQLLQKVKCASHFLIYLPLRFQLITLHFKSRQKEPLL